MAIGSSNFTFSDIPKLDGITRDVGIVNGRNLIIDALRECFARDAEWRYVKDIFGFPKTPSHLGLSDTAGLDDFTTTRIFIGTSYRYEQSYLPAISVRQTSSAYHPISFNQNMYNIEYEMQRIEDAYGEVSFIRQPARYTFAGAWDQSFEIKVVSNSQEDTSAIADIVMVSLQSTYRHILQENGLFIKQISAGGEQAESIGANDPVFSISITANTFSEWRREIEIRNTLDRIKLCFNIDLGSDKDVPANNLSFEVDLE